MPKVLDALASRGVTVHGDSRVAAYGEIIPVEERDFAEEYLSLDIAVAIMGSREGLSEQPKDRPSADLLGF